MKPPLDDFSRSPETERLSGNTSILTLVDRLWLRTTRSSERSVTAQRISPVQRPRLELEYLLEPRSNRLSAAAGGSTMALPRGRLPKGLAIKIGHGSERVVSMVRERFRPHSNHNRNRLARFAMAMGRLASNR